MTIQRNAAVVLAMCSWARKRLTEVEERAKDAADVSFPEEKTAGVIDGTVVSYTQRIQKRPELKILNPGDFTDWVAKRWPTEIIMTVRESFLPVLREIATEHGALIDQDGEVCDACELIDGTVYTTTRLTKDADAVLEPELSKLRIPDLLYYIEGISES
jgi:hypothetical protein